MSKVKFKDGAGDFIKKLAKKIGDDLIYSLALENGNFIMCVTAHPSMTTKRFLTESEMRLLFLIDEDDFNLPQDELIENMAAQIQHNLVDVSEIKSIHDLATKLVEENDKERYGLIDDSTANKIKSS